MVKKQTAKAGGPLDLTTSGGASMAPVVAATLAGVIYQAKLVNRQAKLNIPESEVLSDVLNLWCTVMDSILPRLK